MQHRGHTYIHTYMKLQTHHANRARSAESVTPATKRCSASISPSRRQTSTDKDAGTESTTPATQMEPEVLKASRLPRKMQRRQFDPVRRQACVDIYGGTESATPCCCCCCWRKKGGGGGGGGGPGGAATKTKTPQHNVGKNPELKNTHTHTHKTHELI